MQEARQTPITDEERLIIQNLFDTQPARRQAYLKQLGFEMDPKDDNKYRPIGSGSAYGEIDPGVSAYFKKGGLHEFANDAKDILADIVIKGPLIMGGAAAGGMGGAVAGAPVGAAAGMPHVGAAVLAMTGAILGGAAGSAASEELKKHAGDIFLKEDIPQDRKLEAVQALSDGTFNMLFGAGKIASSAMVRTGIEQRQKAILQALGSGANHEVLLRVAREPELFSPDNAKNGVKNLTGIYRDLFGLDDPSQISRPDQIKTGAFRSAIEPLNDKAKEYLGQLGTNSQADFTVDQLTKPLKEKIYQLVKNKFPTEEEAKGIDYLKKMIKQIEDVGVSEQEKRYPSNPNVLNEGKPNLNTPDILNAEMQNPAPGIETPPKSGVNSPVGQNRISFDQAYNLAKKIQDDAWDKEVPGSNFLKQVTGGKNTGLTDLLDTKAQSLGVPLQELNAQRSQILKTYKTAAQTLTPANIQNAFLSTNKDNVTKHLVREAAGDMDRVLGSNYSQAIENGSVQAWVNDLYTNARSAGSKSINAEMVKGAVKGGVKGAAVGGAAGTPLGMTIPGAVAGGVTGAAMGAKEAAMMANPTQAIGAYARGAEQLSTPNPNFLGQMLSQPLSTQAATSEGAALLAPDFKGQATLAPQTQADPWAVLDETHGTAPTPNPQPSVSQQPPSSGNAASPKDPWAILDTP